MATRAKYSLGSPVRPDIKFDNGFLDKFPRRTPTLLDRANFSYWAAYLEAGEAGQGIPFVPHNHVSDALAAYRHFLYGHGTSRQFSYERYVKDDPSGAITLQNLILDGEEGAEELYAANFSNKDEVQFQITSNAIGLGTKGDSLFPYPATENWQKAIGYHNAWMSANVEVKTGGSFKMTLTLHVEDMYNFNPGMHDIATGIPDSANGIFEITGLATQYINYSTLTRDVTWTLASDKNKTTAPSSGRERQPQDNRRARNRL